MVILERPPRRRTMRLLLLIVAICVGFIGMGKSADAQNYPWCAHLGTGFDSTNCGFTTFQQCMETVSGIGGFCMENNTYQPSAGLHPLTRVQRCFSY
jgi:hypothetical protein